MQDYRKLVVWKKAHMLALLVYKVTKEFPTDERFALVSQLRRAAVSIPANLAEGCGRQGKGELTRYVQIASGSASEVEYFFLLSKDLGYITEEEFVGLNDGIGEIKRMLTNFTTRLRAPINNEDSKTKNH